MTALVGYVRGVVESIEEYGRQISGNIFPGRSVLVPQSQGQSQLGINLPHIVQIESKTGGAELRGSDLRGNLGQRYIPQQEGRERIALCGKTRTGGKRSRILRGRNREAET